MKIIGLSDMHGDLGSPIDMPQADVYCICGDIVPLWYQDSLVKSIVWLTSEFYPWCQQLPCDKVFYIAGNHDFVYEWLMTDKGGNHRKAKEVDKLFLQPNKKVQYLENSYKEYNGVKFYGTPWCPELKRWAFYRPDEELTKEFAKIPEDTDVLLTHCPPKIDDYGTVLEGGVRYGLYGSNFGCQPLADRLQQIHPKLHIFGHVHSGLHEPKEINGTTFCNVSVKNENYKVTYYPREFEI